MLRRGKHIRFLFWSAASALFFYGWIIILGLQAYLNGHISQESATAMVILYMLLAGTLLAGIILAVLIGNRFYTVLFAWGVIFTVGSLIGAKGVWG